MNRLVEAVKQTVRKIKNSIIQPCPPELYACEVCGKLECDNEEWLNCERRLRVATETKRLLESEEQTCQCNGADVESTALNSRVTMP